MKKLQKFNGQNLSWRPLLRDRRFWATAVCLLCVLLALGSMAMFRYAGKSLRSQQAAEEWAEEAEAGVRTAESRLHGWEE